MAAGSIVCGLGFALEHIFEAFKKIYLGNSLRLAKVIHMYN